MQNSALIIIDIQAGIKRMFKNSQPHSWNEMLSNNKKLMEKFESEGQSVYLFSQRYYQDS
ncbi:MAG: hypothetical protein FWF42_04545 [Streptococcaceae bacterium]|nr:hypothetical protein [Streptococcaceae bacterium]MCL2858945.1 hypothetical protein [Streptococcaceae bacterium]